MEFTKEQLDSSLAGLKDLQKSLESSQHGKILQKSTTPADQEKEVPSNTGGENDLNKSGAANKLSGNETGPQYDGKEGGQASERKDESYEKAGDHKYDDDEKMSKMKKDDDDDDKDDKKEKMEKMKYSHADDGDESSLVKSFTEDGELKKAIDVSKFLGSLVNKTTECLDQMDSRLHKSFSHLLEQSNVQNQVIQQLAVENSELKKSFDQVLSQPAYAARSAGVGVGLNAVGRGPDDLNKSMSPNLDPRVMKKSILNGMMKDVESGSLNAQDLIKYETTDEISEEHFRHYGQRT